ncbi:putative lipase domain protein [Diplonema papillatum]|nr:putative lipase domain protein [Diplonema papillatum]
MPELLLCGRAWTVGSDDFVFPGIRLGLVQVTIAVGVALTFNLGSDMCGSNAAEYILTSFVVHVASAVCNFAVAIASSRGGILEDNKRKLVPALLNTQMLLVGITLGVSLWGLFLVTQDVCEDHPSSRDWLTKFVIVQMSVVCLSLCLLMMDYNCTRELPDASEQNYSSEYAKVWKGRCESVCCLGGQNAEMFAEIADVLAGVFSGLDLVPSDIVAGMLLMRARQHKEMRAVQVQAGLRTPAGRAAGHEEIKLSHEARAVPQLAPDERKQLEDDVETLRKYSKFFVAAYGWPLFVFTHPVTCCCVLGPQACCHGLPKPGEGEVVVVADDTCCSCNTAAWGLETKRSASIKLLHAHWISEVNRPTYYVAVDGETESIVVAIRGTMSREDILTDVNADVMPFGEDIVEGGYAHKGIAKAALSIKRALVEKKLLKRAFEEHPEYKLVVLGHSLGAGTACLLAIALKKEYAGVLGLGYSVPGGLMNETLAEACRGFVIGNGVGQDVIIRTSIQTVRKFRDQMLEVFSTSHQPKCSIFSCCCCMSTDKQADAWFRPVPTDPGSDTSESNRLIARYLQNLTVAGKKNVMPLYPPARFVHIMRVGTTGAGHTVYQPVYYNIKELMAGGILSSGSMVIDHMPDVCAAVLQKLGDKKYRADLEGWGDHQAFANLFKASRLAPTGSDYATTPST